MLVNKRNHNPGNRGNCLMMQVVYFGRIYYGFELWVPTMGNQGSTGYLVIQLLVVRAMPGLRHHTSCFFMWGCGLQLLKPYGLSWFSAISVRPWYRACTIPFQNTFTTLADSYNNDCLFDMWENGLVRLIITNQTRDIY